MSESFPTILKARAPLTLAATLRPERADYRLYRERARRTAEAA